MFVWNPFQGYMHPLNIKEGGSQPSLGGAALLFFCKFVPSNHADIPKPIKKACYKLSRLKFCKTGKRPYLRNYSTSPEFLGYMDHRNSHPQNFIPETGLFQKNEIHRICANLKVLDSMQLHTGNSRIKFPNLGHDLLFI